MSFSQMQRRAWLIALATMAGVGALVLCYWQGVRSGRLPSPIQPLVAEAKTLVLPSTPDAAVIASEGAPSRERLAEAVALGRPPAIEQPKPAGQRPTMASKPIPTARPAPAEMAEAAPVSQPAVAAPEPAPNAAAASVRPAITTGPSHAAPQGSRPSPADEKLAQQWLVRTNERPVVRVHYDPAEILRLVQLGRGVIVASGTGKAAQRELYLQSESGGTPLFAPYAPSIANRYSSYSLVLEPSPAWDQLTSGFPAYFPDGAAGLAFVPDPALATAMFAEVARTGRAAGAGTHLSRGTIFEGELSLRGTEPVFQVLRTLSATAKGRAGDFEPAGG